MTPLQIKVKKLHPDLQVILPTYMSHGASGMDLCAVLADPIQLKPMERCLVPCGFSIEIPEGFEAQVRPRSGLAIRHGITCLNSPGTIDHDYRGEVKVVLINLGSEDFSIKNGDRIAQMVIQKVERGELEWAEELQETKRGDGGFGSTGH